LDAVSTQNDRQPSQKNNFDFCICFQMNLCYGVYIPVEEQAEIAASELEVSCVTGLPARTARPFVPSFFVRNSAFASCSTSDLLPAQTGSGLQLSGENSP
jgi:hypothetical protein